MKFFIKLNVGVLALLIITQIIAPLAHIALAYEKKNTLIHCESKILYVRMK